MDERFSLMEVTVKEMEDRFGFGDTTEQLIQNYPQGATETAGRPPREGGPKEHPRRGPQKQQTGLE